MTEAHTIVVATGGTAGHIEPALAVADALTERDPRCRIIVMGTDRGLETEIVPARGYELVLVPAVPLPRRITPGLVTLPWRLWRARAAARKVFRERHVSAVVGFGGYASLPAYLAAGRHIPIIVHEANARAGLANKIGARRAVSVAAAVAGSGLAHATVTGNPVRHRISSLDRAALRDEARAFWGLAADAPTVLVTGGSQGAERINTAVRDCAADFAAAGIGVLHHYGRKNVVAPVHQTPAYVLTDYIDRMDLAYAAADLVVARAGAMTVAEVAAVGLPAVFVPLPHGNGEQRLNAADRIAAGAGLEVRDEDFTSEAVRRDVIGLITDADRFDALRRAAADTVHTRADVVIADMVLAALKARRQ